VSARLALCALDEVDVFVAFLREHWRADHVLVTDRRVLDWQHRDEDAGHYDVVLAWEGDEVVGVLGFIPASRYDPALAQGQDTLWLTTWRVRDDRASGLGLSMLRWLERSFAPRWMGTVGLKPSTRGIYDALGYRTGVMERHFLLHPSREEFVLATGVDAAAHRAAHREDPRPVARRADATLTPIAAEVLLASTEGLGLDDGPGAPARTRRQVLERYLTHPFYDYDVHLARASDTGPAALLVTRVCEHDGARAVRIVDIVGDPSALAGAPLVDLVITDDAEYLDAYSVDGADALRAAGMRPLAQAPGLVLPGHFEPFEQRNVELSWALKGPVGPGGLTIIGKGDADQDRPSLPGADVRGAR
jgi:hypothetical protein